MTCVSLTCLDVRNLLTKNWGYRHVQLAQHTVADEESESEVKAFKMLEPGGEKTLKTNIILICTIAITVIITTAFSAINTLCVYKYIHIYVLKRSLNGILLI